MSTIYPKDKFAVRRLSRMLKGSTSDLRQAEKVALKEFGEGQSVALSVGCARRFLHDVRHISTGGDAA